MKAEIINLLKLSPGLKGREIANQLGQNKKDVNSLLYSEESGLFVVKDHRWYLTSSELVIRVEKTGWLRVSDFDDILCDNKDVWSPLVESVTFKFCNCAILLGAIARILCLVNQLAMIGKEITLDFSECKESFSYLCRVGLFDELDDAVKVVPEVEDLSCHYGQNDKVMEFVSIPANTNETDLPAKLKDSFIKLAGVEHANTAFGFIAEFINNIIEHSQTPIPGVAALQVYGKNSQNVQTVFSDSGLGILGTLRPVLEERYPKLSKEFPEGDVQSDIGLLKKVLERGRISGADDEEYTGRGLGLKLSADQAAKFDATVCVRQENFEVTLKYRNGVLYKFSYRSNLKKLKGTHICFDFYLD